jgi:uncharacterized protein (TIGR02453 family)
MPFQGFPEDGLSYLGELALNNNKQWFDSHRQEFDEYLLEPAKELVVELGEKLQQQISPGIHAEPRVNGSIMRMNRDIRFSKDKTPYKTWFGLWFWEGDQRSMECSGFYLGIQPDDVTLGTGRHGFEKESLDHYRAAVVDPTLSPEPQQALDAVRKAGDYDIGGRHYKQVPTGFDRNHERADLLLHNGLHVGKTFGDPPELHTPGFVDFCIGHYAAIAPVHRWLLRATQAPSGT